MFLNLNCKNKNQVEKEKEEEAPTAALDGYLIHNNTNYK
jgi:hypothetical protein